MSHSCAQKLTKEPDSEIVIHVIDKDLDRTFPTHVLFAKKGAQGCVYLIMYLSIMHCPTTVKLTSDWSSKHTLCTTRRLDTVR